jgi:hypothetical protein
MKPEHKTIEDIFTSAKGTGLSMSEQHDMWEELKSYAEFYPVKPVAKKSVMSKYAWQLMSGVTASLCLFVGVGYAAHVSLPGDTLYALKVEVMEPLAGSLETSEAEKLAYHISLLERRLEEAKLLQEENPNNVAISDEYIDEHVANILAVVSEDSDTSLPEDVVLETLVKAKGITRAHEIITDDSPADTTANDSLAQLDTIYDSTANEFAEEHPTEALSYLDEVLDTIDESGLIGSSTAKTTEDNLEEVATALADGSIDEALSSVSDIQEELLVTEYLSE